MSSRKGRKNYFHNFPWFEPGDREKLMKISEEYTTEPSVMLVIQDLWLQGLDNEGLIFNYLNFKNSGRPSANDWSMMNYEEYLLTLKAVKAMWGTEIPLKKDMFD